MTTQSSNETLLTPDALLEHWMGHKRLTRRVIEAFPDDKLFEFSIGGMRSFGKLGCEFLGMALPVVRGLITGTWEHFKDAQPATKDELLAAWDKQMAQLKEEFPSIPVEKFRETTKAFGQWEMTGLGLIEYAMDNEIHHRGQGYVYLRALGIAPPAFWERN